MTEWILRVCGISCLGDSEDDTKEIPFALIGFEDRGTGEEEVFIAYGKDAAYLILQSRERHIADQKTHQKAIRCIAASVILDDKSLHPTGPPLTGKTAKIMSALFRVVMEMSDTHEQEEGETEQDTPN